MPPDIEIATQPDETSCGPACLSAIYRHWGAGPDLLGVLQEVDRLAEGGTLGVILANHALEHGYHAQIYTYNVQLFDPTWLDGKTDIRAKLAAQAHLKHGVKLRRATAYYERFFELGGELRHAELTAELLRDLLAPGEPIIAGLSATYLYRAPRELDDQRDDVGGLPVGHFVLLTRFDERSMSVRVADPYPSNVAFGSSHYDVPVQRLINSILIGVITDDANLILLRRPR